MSLELGSGNDAKREQSFAQFVSIASVECLAMAEPSDLAIVLYIIFSFVLFISGIFLGAKFSPARERKAREPWHARLAAAEGEPRHDGTKGSMNLLAVLLALVVVFGVIVVDHFKGPLFRTCSTASTDRSS
jgi:hypothetical protein